MGKHLISPNVHVIMVHFPLGILVFGLFLEIFSFLWRRSSVTVAARWMILFGALMSVPAAFSGIDALRDVYDHSSEDISEQARMLLRSHLLWASLGAGLSVLAAVIGMALSAEGRNRLLVRLPLLLVLIAGASMMGFGSHYGGEGVYLQSVAVKLGGKTAKGFEYYAPARSTHILLSGFAVAVGLGALGASLRVLGMHSIPRRQQEDAERDLEALESGGTALYTPPTPPRRVTDDVSVARTLNADAVVEPPRVPAGRFWLLTSLIALAAFGFGVWLLLSVESNFFEEHRATPGGLSADRGHRDLDLPREGRERQRERNPAKPPAGPHRSGLRHRRPSPLPGGWRPVDGPSQIHRRRAVPPDRAGDRGPGVDRHPARARCPLRLIASLHAGAAADSRREVTAPSMRTKRPPHPQGLFSFTDQTSRISSPA